MIPGLNSTDHRRDIILAFYEALNDADIDRVLSFYSAKATVEVFSPGMWGKQKPTRKLLQGMFSAVPELNFKVRGILCEGRHLAVEVSSKGVLASGEKYENHYHNFFEVRDGLITKLREYPTVPFSRQ